jgi:YHS domain-containing protein
MGVIGQGLHRIGLLAGAMVLAATAVLADPAVNATSEGIAVDGFDVVNYFTDNAPAEGLPEHSVSYLGRQWHFASAEHAAMFAADPAKYAPQVNGYCSYAASEGYAAEVDVIDGWAVIDGKLYLNWNAEVRDTFVAEQAARIPKVGTNTPKVLAGLLDGTTEFYPHSSDPSVGISHPQKLN